MDDRGCAPLSAHAPMIDNLKPLELVCQEHPRWLSAGLVGFVAFGLVLRLVRYAQNLPLWSDECFLAANFIQRGYRELLQPLDNGQICPVLFLWIERFVVDLLGFSEWSLRLFPLLCGLGSVFAFRFLAGRLMEGIPLLFAVGVFAVSLHPIRHSAEVKPYASDLLMAILLFLPAVEWLRRPGQTGWLWLLAFLVPLALLLSNPAVFVAGGIGLGIAWPVWRKGGKAVRLAFSAFAALLIGSFLLLYTGIVKTQSATAAEGLKNYWAPSFPPVMNAGRLAVWLVSTHTGSMFAYPGGGANGLSTATFLAVVLGALILWRSDRKTVLICLASPFALTFAAAALKRYPYGGEARISQFLAPSICLCCGLGAAELLCRIRSVGVRGSVLLASILGLLACGVGPQVVSYRQPFRMPYDRESREFARAFWPEQARQAELACAHLDFGLLRPGKWNGRKAWYLCNQAIYSPARRGPAGRHPARSTEDRPLRCVVFEESPNSMGVTGWLDQMRLRYRIKQCRTFQTPVTLGLAGTGTEQWMLYDFVPASEPSEPRAVAGAGRLIVPR